MQCGKLDGKDIFIHRSAFPDFEKCKMGDWLEFETQETAKGIEGHKVRFAEQVKVSEAV